MGDSTRASLCQTATRGVTQLFYAREQGAVPTDGEPDPDHTNYACEQVAVSVPCADGDPGSNINIG